MSQIKKSKHGITRRSVSALLGGLFSAVLLINPASSLANDQSMSRYSALPPLAYSIESGRSVMLTLSLDHQLFMKAYNDFSDLTGDGVPNRTYTDTNHYVGYFDSTVCYSYTAPQNNTNGVFTPAGRAPSGAGSRCAEGQWHGNFLNWATMTRIDLLRQVLYGGYRSVDDSNLTILERSYLPQDAHSFAKYWPEDDLVGLADVRGVASCDEGGVAGRCQGYTLCNTTRPLPRDNQALSQAVNQPPLLRVVKGDYRFWDAGERYQCLTGAELPTIGAETSDWGDLSGVNLNDPDLTGVPAFPRSPEAGSVVDYHVRVVACHDVFGPTSLSGYYGIDDSDGSDTQPRSSYECRSYPGDATSKPTGLLHTVESHVEVGLMTGSYNSNKNYGVLRKAPAPFAEEVAEDGTFRTDLPASIVANINAFRIVDYRLYHSDNHLKGTYLVGNNHPNSCEWGRTGFNDGQCRSWGNPFSEILTESYRYIFGAEEDAERVQAADDAGLLDGLSVVSWPTRATNNQAGNNALSCRRGSVLGVNASAVSYDWSDAFAATSPDELGLTEMGGMWPSLAALTNNLVAPGQYFVGAVAGEDDEICTPKQIGEEATGLGTVRGTCPEAPRLEGGYLGAGLAKFMFEEHGISTFGVSLTDAIPRIRIPLPGDSDDQVVIVPACRNRGYPHPDHNDANAVRANPDWEGVNQWRGARSGNCALISFKIIEDRLQGNKRVGTYFIGWDDTEQGGDYDIDASGLISYELDTSTGDLTVSTQLIYNGTQDRMEFGFIISGTDQDFAYFPAHTPGLDENFGTFQYIEQWEPRLYADWTPTRSDCNGNGYGGIEGLADCVEEDITVGPENEERTAIVQRLSFTTGQDGTAVDFLPSPLRLAATHGSAVGEAGYANVENPADLRSRLGNILQEMFNEPTPGTGAAPAVNIVGGEGLALSSLYAPQIDAGGETVNWIGRFNALYFKEGHFWEDCDGSGVITDNDCVVVTRLDEATNQTVFDRYPPASIRRDESGRIQLVDNDTAQLGLAYEQLRPLWSADNWLSGVDSPEEQRAFGAITHGRHILTAIPQMQSNIVLPGLQNNTVFPFHQDRFSLNGHGGAGIGIDNYRLLNVGDREAAINLVNYIRGDETIEGTRNRTLNGKRHLLGDIIHSSAAIVGRPSAFYDNPRIGDTTYTAYARAYRNRRNVTYVGSNSGMLHAFNGGFFNGDADAPGYLESPPAVEGQTPANIARHDLGAELWAYVPYNLLPHLKWLQNPNYSHVYYVDGDVQTFDVNIFTPSETHINGWGTIIVARMRLGGGEYALQTTADNRTLRSAYIIFDVTDPEAPPSFLGEITHPNLGFTTSNVDLVSFRQPNATDGTFAVPARNEWYLAFGSGPQGPDALQQGTSNNSARLFFLDLRGLVNRDENSLIPVDTGIENSYVGGVTAVDWNGDFHTDMIYFGTVDTASGGGALMQMPVGPGDLEGDIAPLLDDVDRPFSSPPLVVRDFSADGYWVYGGTGKLLVTDHLLPDNIGDNWLYGVRVNNPFYDGTEGNGERWITGRQEEEIGGGDLRDITGVSVQISVNEENGARGFTVNDGERTLTPEEMEIEIRENSSGWSKQLVNDNELMFTSPTFSGTTLAASSFSPLVGAGDECQASGRSRLYWLNLFTGLPQTDNRFVYVEGVPVLPSDLDPGTEISDVAVEQEGATVGSATGGSDVLIGGDDGGVVPLTSEGPPTTPVRRAWRELSNEDLR